MARRRKYSTPEQLSALTSPVRQEIVDAVVSLGPASVSQIAKALGRPPDSLYFHIRKLLRVEVLAESGHRRTGGRDESLYRMALPEAQLRPDPRSPGAIQNAMRAASTLLRMTERNVRKAFELGLARLSGKKKNLCAGRSTGWLTLEQVAEVQQRIDEIHELLRSSPPGPSSRRADLYSATLVLCPLQEKGPTATG